MKYIQGTIWNLLGNQSWIRLCGDGVYRISVEGYLLVIVGVLAKGPSLNDGGGGTSTENFMTTSFFPLTYGLVNKESYVSYRRCFVALNEAMEKCVGVPDFAARVKQFHADLHFGAEKARQEVYPSSHRAMDFSHFTGANRQKIAVPAVEARVP
jgi:hypothetical protein